MSEKRPKIFVLVGPPGSGKTTYANSLVNETGAVYVNQDSQGHRHREIFAAAVAEKRDVVVDRMNFSLEQRSRYVSTDHDREIHVFQVPRETCFDRVMARENHETIKDAKSATSALDVFFGKFERPTNDEGQLFFHGHDGKRAKCVVVDLDGTLCNISHRLSLIKNGNKDWGAFFRAISDDSPNRWCVDLCEAMRKDGFAIVFASGRSDAYRGSTKKWLSDHGISYHSLFMRPAFDMRKDSVVKEIILDFEILPLYNPLFFVDDRNQVVDMWRRRGFVCLQCDDGNF